MSELLSRLSARASDDRDAVVDAATGERASYAEIVGAARAVAGGLLREAGARSLDGARVAILAPPGPSFVAAFFGVLFAGGCVVVLSPLHPAPETRYFCGDAGVRFVLVAAEHEALAASLRDALPVRALEPLLPGRGSRSAFEGEPDAAIAIERASRSPTGEDPAPALQLYTSGTTGRPKGAILSHANLAIQQRLVGEAWGFSERDVLLHALPLHHMHGLAIALLTALGAGATTRTMSFDAPVIWDEMERATVFMGVPAMYHRLFLAFDAAGTAERVRWARSARALRLATSGSAALPVTLAERWRELTGTIPLERFGMTEIGVGITNRLHGERFAGSVGFPLPTVEARIVGEGGEDAETGELWIRGPSVFLGYHDRGEETKKAFAPDLSGGAPWFRTGDTVTRDRAKEGAPFRILGRTSVDILKSGGYKLSALEIEEALREHPSVGEVAVLGVPDEAWGERVVACIVRRPGAEPCDAAALRSFARERLATYKVPKDILFLGELPKNALGKVVKAELMTHITHNTL